jgi:hypothetical protein
MNIYEVIAFVGVLLWALVADHPPHEVSYGAALAMGLGALALGLGKGLASHLDPVERQRRDLAKGALKRLQSTRSSKQHAGTARGVVAKATRAGQTQKRLADADIGRREAAMGGLTAVTAMERDNVNKAVNENIAKAGTLGERLAVAKTGQDIATDVALAEQAPPSPLQVGIQGAMEGVGLGATVAQALKPPKSDVMSSQEVLDLVKLMGGYA